MELLVLVAVMAVLAAFLLPSLANRNRRSPDTACVNQLKQLGVAFRLYANDNDGLYPMQQFASSLGSSNVLSTSAAAIRAFAVMSNEIANARLLTCPTSKIQGSEGWTNLEERVTYFVEANASGEEMSRILAGDGHLTANGKELPLWVRLQRNQWYGWSDKLHPKKGVGMLLMVNGSAFGTASNRLDEVVAKSLEDGSR